MWELTRRLGDYNLNIMLYGASSIAGMEDLNHDHHNHNKDY
jgi:hypothetical protein